MTRSEIAVALVYTAIYFMVAAVVRSHQWLSEGILTLLSLPVLAVIWTQHIVRRAKAKRIP